MRQGRARRIVNVGLRPWSGRSNLLLQIRGELHNGVAYLFILLAGLVAGTALFRRIVFPIGLSMPIVTVPGMLTFVSHPRALQEEQ